MKKGGGKKLTHFKQAVEPNRSKEIRMKNFTYVALAIVEVCVAIILYATFYLISGMIFPYSYGGFIVEYILLPLASLTLITLGIGMCIAIGIGITHLNRIFINWTEHEP